MSALTKVASMILLADQKLCVLSARINAILSDAAYKAATATFRRNTAKANALEFSARQQAEKRADALYAQYIRAQQQSAQLLTIQLEDAEYLHDQACRVEASYDSIGSALYAHAADQNEAAQKLAGLRAQL